MSKLKCLIETKLNVKKINTFFNEIHKVKKITNHNNLMNSFFIKVFNFFFVYLFELIHSYKVLQQAFMVHHNNVYIL